MTPYAPNKIITENYYYYYKIISIGKHSCLEPYEKSQSPIYHYWKLLYIKAITTTIEK